VPVLVTAMMEKRSSSTQIQVDLLQEQQAAGEVEGHDLVC
jgi:hypothetical protein